MLLLERAGELDLILEDEHSRLAEVSYRYVAITQRCDCIKLPRARLCDDYREDDSPGFFPQCGLAIFTKSFWRPSNRSWTATTFWMMWNTRNVRAGSVRSIA